MKFEDRKEAFPKMPKGIEMMIAEEVEKQMKKGEIVPMKKYKMKRKSMAAAIAVAVMAFGTTVFAAVQYYNMTAEKVGEYGVKTKIELLETENTNETETVDEAENWGGTETVEDKTAYIEVPKVVCEVGYLPEGMVRTEEQKYHYEGKLPIGGLSFVFYAMDLGDDAFEMFDTNIAYQEEMVVSGKNAIYLEEVTEKEGEEPHKKMYVFFSDVHYVMELFISKEVPKEEAIRFAEGITLRPATEADKKEDIAGDYVWSVHIEELSKDYGYVEDESKYRILKEEMKIHEIGEEVETGSLSACVEKVEIFDDINILSEEYVDKEILFDMGVVDKEGNLIDAEKKYYKRGNGINTTNELLKTENIPLKLVYLTVSYKNHGTEDLKEALFNGRLVQIVEEGEEFVCQNRLLENEKEFVAFSYGGSLGDGMFYYDVHGGERNNNYIPFIKAGETVTVHMGFIVMEDLLPIVYVSFDNYSSHTFRDTGLEMGYVDIRQ